MRAAELGFESDAGFKAEFNAGFNAKFTVLLVAGAAEVLTVELTGTLLALLRKFLNPKRSAAFCIKPCVMDERVMGA
jgi:hypothetical protein